MRKLLSGIIVLLVHNIYAQTNLPLVQASVPNPTSSLTPHQGTNYTAGASLNFIRVWEPQMEMDLETDVTDGGHPVEEVHRTTQYFDGLGRLIQTVAWQQSSIESKADLVSSQEYDALGRQQYVYLPFASTQVSGTDPLGNGGFKYNAFSQYAAFCATQYPGETYNNNKQFNYNHIIYESSSLNRVLKSFAPGNSWSGTEGTAGERPVIIGYFFNDVNDQVRIWNIQNNPLSYDASGNISSTLNIPTSAGNYSTGQLSEVSTTDENGKKTVEYKDNEGKLILKKVQIESTQNLSNAHLGWLCTYYVYDDANMLRFVIPPAAVNAISGTWTIASDIADELCFRYEYDSRGRMIAKKVPGVGWTYMVYDKRDRLVYSQDAKLRYNNNSNQGQWLTILYDIENRPITTGMLLINKTVSTQNAFDYLMSKMLTIDYTSNATALGETSYANPLKGINGNSSFIPLTRTHYDTYNFTNTNGTTPANYDNTQLSNLLSYDPNAVGVENNANKTSQLIGMATGTEVRVIEDATNLTQGSWLITTNYYDAKGRPLQSISSNYKGGNEVNTNLYDFRGKILSSFTDHTISSSLSTHNHRSVGSDIDYDQAGRVLKIRKRLFDNGQLIQAVRIAENTYNKLGQLQTKKLGLVFNAAQGNYTTGDPLETLNYEYNIRGWLKSINKDYVSSNTSPSWFGMQLSYDWGFNSNQYNGNISGTIWRSKGDGQIRAYGFGYDNSNRLLFADFNQFTSNAWNKNAGLDFSTFMGNGIDYASAYDANGNILKMKEMGVYVTNTNGTTALSIKPIDDLSYSYVQNTNKLLSVEDAAAGVPSGMGDFTNKNASAPDYGYDINGNLITDLNKKLNGSSGIIADQDAVADAIIYNYLNLPWQITVTNDNTSTTKGIIQYIYDALGNKIEKRVDELPSATNGNIETKTNTTYIGQFVYETVTTIANGTTQTGSPILQYINHEEGRIREQYNTNGTLFRYNLDYYVKDHLGNIRMVLTDELKTESAIATMEPQYATNENQLFYNVSSTVFATSQVPSFPPDPNNTNLSKTNSGTASKRIGPARVIKVMAGDQVTASVKSFYTQSTTGNDNIKGWSTIATQLMNLLFANNTAPGALSDLKGAPSDIGNLTFNNASAFITQTHVTDASMSNKPKAFLNVLVYDEYFNLSTTLSKAIYACPQSPTYNALYPLSSGAITVKNNGYVYIYVSNESTDNVDVYFDDLSILQEHGPLVEENHYYPFGLPMQGISSKALAFGNPENKKKFNGIEYNTDFDINTLDAFYRNLDPQIGRTWQIDPKPNMMESPYSMMGNNPIRYSDPLGDTAIARTQDQANITSDLKKVYKKSFFSFNSNGQLQFTAKGLKALAKYQNYTGNNAKKAAMAESLKGMDKLVNGTEKTAIVYSNDALNYTFSDRTGATKTGVRPTDTGGELTITKGDNTGISLSLDGQAVDNAIFINPASSTTSGVNPTLIPNVTPEQLTKAILNGGQYPVTNNRYNLLMHGIGHTLYQGANEQPKVIQFDNANRKLSGDPKNEDLDGSHH